MARGPENRDRRDRRDRGNPDDRADSDIVVSSRIRLARNLTGYPFTLRANATQRRELEAILSERVMGAGLADGLFYLNVKWDRTAIVPRRWTTVRDRTKGQSSSGSYNLS